MTIPIALRAEVAALASAVTAAAPLQSATRIQIAALQQQGGKVIADIETAIGAASGDLDEPETVIGAAPGPTTVTTDASDFSFDFASQFDQSIVVTVPAPPALPPRFVNGDPSMFPGEMVDVLLGLATASEDQATLCDMRGLVGRAMFNLAQAGA